jgi:hypothetical protein
MFQLGRSMIYSLITHTHFPSTLTLRCVARMKMLASWSTNRRLSSCLTLRCWHRYLSGWSVWCLQSDFICVLTVVIKKPTTLQNYQSLKSNINLFLSNIFRPFITSSSGRLVQKTYMWSTQVYNEKSKVASYCTNIDINVGTFIY